jgi:hypothetical protein
VRRLLLAVVASAVAGLLVVPGAAAQAPTGDFVTGTGANFFFSDIQVDAHSDPKGGNPTGRVSLQTSIGVAGPVTCLAVSGNRALIGFEDPIVGHILALAIDNRPPGATNLPPDEFYAGPALPADDCLPLISGTGGQLLRGDIVVHDAPPLPVSKDQCQNDGWRNFPGFKNQGACVSFVATGGKKPPAG